jgi:acyl-CoA thioester hydrolase
MTEKDSRPADRPQPQARSAYRHFNSISTRWIDNDAVLQIHL